ncbi:MAG: hypothetical protein M4579_005098 [Chaenotheca gracillima]|nr:MAG: hypothetical protein M4579_005098 [Chaenotheca gracillima]
MDLIAVATGEEQVFVYRLNGQRVSAAGTKLSPLHVRSLHWKSNGQSLAIAWSDGVVRIVSADNNKVINQITVLPEKEEDQITCLGWGINFTDSRGSKARIEGSGDVLDDIVGQFIQTSRVGQTLDLPRDLAAFDIDGALPKLSILPSGGRTEDIFSTRASIDALFSPLRKKEDESVDVLVTGTANGAVHLSIFDCISLGSFNLGIKSDRLRGCRVQLHASHPYSSTHTLLVASGSSAPVLVPFDLLFISNSGAHLSLLASKSSQLQNLRRYVNQVQILLQNEWKSSQDLPTRFLRNIDESLMECIGMTFVQGAYHLVVTGDCPSALKEWLVDELAERGHKRWEKAVTTGYENILRFTHEGLLPALERCSLVTSRLRGLSKYQKSSVALGLDTPDLNQVMDAINSLNLVAHNILKIASQELAQFGAFSTWLRHEIDTQAGDPESTDDDPEETDMQIQHFKVLDYIQGALTGSPLKTLLAVDIVDSDSGDMQYENIKRLLGSHNTETPKDSKLPSLETLNRHFFNQSKVVFSKIAEAQRRHVRVGEPVILDIGGDVKILDMKMRYENDCSCNYIALTLPHAAKDLIVFRVAMSIRNGLSSTRSVEVASMRLGSGQIGEAKFADDYTLVTLWHGIEATHILSIPYSSSAEGNEGLSYTAWKMDASAEGVDRPTRTSIPITILNDKDTIVNYSKHVFLDRSFAPWKLEVNGRKGRRVICVFSKDKVRYRMFDMDSSMVEEAE